ncbi:MAG: DUF2336 domain-containing protein [Alphaproteobacteria bacterium]
MTGALDVDPANIDVRQLLALAHDKSVDSRRALLQNISDLFMDNDGRLSERERALMAGIVTQLIHDVEMSVRKELAERLATQPNAPRELIVTLANDAIEIAHPILRQSGVLNDADLIDIVKGRTQEHRLAVAMRSELSFEVSQALIDSGSQDVIETLINNHDAELSRRAMDYLVSESQRVDRFQQPLLRRPDLPVELAHRMFWWVSAALREYVLNNYKTDPTTVDNLIHEVTSKVKTRSEADRSTYNEAEFIVSEIANKGQLDERFLLQCLRRGRIAAFTAALARMAGIDLSLARHIVFDPGGEGLAVLCKACGIDRSVFSSVFLLTREARDGSRMTDPSQLNAMVKIYDNLSQKEAEGALRCWQLNAEYLATVEQIRVAEARQRRFSAPKTSSG